MRHLVIACCCILLSACGYNTTATPVAKPNIVDPPSWMTSLTPVPKKLEPGALTQKNAEVQWTKDLENSRICRLRHKSLIHFIKDRDRRLRGEQ